MLAGVMHPFDVMWWLNLSHSLFPWRVMSNIQRTHWHSKSFLFLSFAFCTLGRWELSSRCCCLSCVSFLCSFGLYKHWLVQGVFTFTQLLQSVQLQISESIVASQRIDTKWNQVTNQHLENIQRANIGFFWRGESPVPGEKPSEKGEDQQQTESTQRQTRIEPRPHRWKGNALTITPFLFPWF